MTDAYPRARSDLARFRRDEAGLSTIELALAAPFLVFAMLGLVDIGLAVSERMVLDRVLRGAAQVAMDDPGQAVVTSVVEQSAGSSFAEAASPPVFSVERYCACLEASGVAVVCSTLCDGDLPASIFYRLDAAHSRAGLILPPIGLSTSAQVQIR